MIRVSSKIIFEKSTIYPEVEIVLLPIDPDGISQYGDMTAHTELCVRSIGLNAVCHSLRIRESTWYGDHPTDMTHRYESDLLDAIASVKPSAPLVLAGFSKAGFAAASLLRRHPHVAAGMIVWDAPLMMRNLARPAMVRTFGDESTFARYRLADRQCESLRRKLIVLGGWSLWGIQVMDFHRQLCRDDVPHEFLWGPKLPHRWDSGWMQPCLEALQCLLRSGREAMSVRADATAI